MSELINASASRTAIRLQLLSTASALVLLAAVSTQAKADDTDRPTVWIELGGQLEHVGEQSDAYVPPFAENAIQHGLISSAEVQKPSNYSLGGEGSVTFQPVGSEWSFTASIRYGRSSTKKRQHQEVQVPGVYYSPNGAYLTSLNPRRPFGPNHEIIPRTADYTAKLNNSHAIVDFRAGREVGLGLLSLSGVSHFDVGVRFAQFTSRSHLNLSADPDPHFGFKYQPFLHQLVPFSAYMQFYKGKPDIARSFHGVGPSLAWSGSVPVIGSSDGDASLALDIGANFSVLFGRQKTSIHHHTTADFMKITVPPKYTHTTYANFNNTSRTRSVVVPNIGGMAGFSLKFPNAKVSIGYRADFFLGAMDGGIETHTSYDRNFYGPFATISIGLGG